ncbi:MAG TPA: sigma-70 family RNA polymerase sigma factor [Gemmatimonadaceae bacterium]|nr:sigma-70 family RNA polymerase sigma factor [Gemmatimonadaceae bacterium]
MERPDRADPDSPPAAGAETSNAQVSERLWRDVHERLTAFVAQRVDHPADVADLVQTVFLRAHQHMSALADEERLLPWLFQITRNTIADYYRSPARRREVGGVAPDGALHLLPDGERFAAALSESGVPGSTELPDPGPASDDASAMRELAACMRPMVEQLPPTYREALTLVEFEGVSQVDLASQLGVSVSGMKSRVQRGRSMLRDTLLACCEVSRSATGGVLDFAARSGPPCGTEGSCATPSDPPQDSAPADRGTPAPCRPEGTSHR